MEFFKKIFGSKEKNARPGQDVELPKNEQDEAYDKTQSIFPYFKQLLPSSDNSMVENLPDDLSEVDKQKIYSVPGLNLVIKNICDDLNCLYVYDTESGLEIIQENELKVLNISADELHEIALTNYMQLVSEQLNTQTNGEAFWFILDGNLEAGLVLVDEIWDQVEEHFKEEIVICVPARDVILATGKSKTNMIADFSEKAKQILIQGDHPLSKNWFIRENKQWNVFRKIID